MAIRTTADFEVTLKAVSRNCAGASRAFGSVLPVLDGYRSEEMPNLLVDLIHHTLRSGLMCICRIWDEDCRSLKDLISVLEDDFIKSHFEVGMAQRVQFHSVFEDKSDWVVAATTGSEDLDDGATCSSLISAMKVRGEKMLSSKELKRIRWYRRHFLAHSTGQKITRNKTIVERDYRNLLRDTVEIIDMFEWLVNDHTSYHQSFLDMVSDDAGEDWQRLNLKAAGS